MKNKGIKLLASDLVQGFDSSADDYNYLLALVEVSLFKKRRHGEEECLTNAEKLAIINEVM